MKIVQAPNKSLVVLLIGAIGGRVFPTGDIHTIMTFIFIGGGFVWSVQEIATGTNWVRRVMGVAVFIFVIRALLAIVAQK